MIGDASSSLKTKSSVRRDSSASPRDLGPKARVLSARLYHKLTHTHINSPDLWLACLSLEQQLAAAGLTTNATCHARSPRA